MNIAVNKTRQTLEHGFHALTAFLTVPEDDSSDSQAKRAIWQGLHPIQRALMATDGSFTLLLSALHGEAIKTKLVEQKQQRLQQADARLQLEKDDPLLQRTVLLKTAASDRPVAYAESSIVLSRLSPAMRRDLQEGSKPIGLLLRCEALETHRTLQDWGECPPPSAAVGIFGSASLLFRTYLIIARAMPIMAIAEYFPCAFPRAKNNKEELSFG